MLSKLCWYNAITHRYLTVFSLQINTLAVGGLPSNTGAVSEFQAASAGSGAGAPFTPNRPFVPRQRTVA